MRLTWFSFSQLGIVSGVWNHYYLRTVFYFKSKHTGASIADEHSKSLQCRDLSWVAALRWVERRPKAVPEPASSSIKGSVRFQRGLKEIPSSIHQRRKLDTVMPVHPGLTTLLSQWMSPIVKLGHAGVCPELSTRVCMLPQSCLCPRFPVFSFKRSELLNPPHLLEVCRPCFLA